MKKFFLQAFILIIVIFSGLFYTTFKSNIFNSPFDRFKTAPAQTKTKQVTINGHILKVEVADTKDLRAKGLSNRDSLPLDSGMLFVFSTRDVPQFWMKGMKFPLDIVWIDGNTVIDITKNAPPPTSGQKDADLPIFSPKSPANRVLEINAGVSDQIDLKEGDTIEIK